jgi:hypothetical protein
MGVNQINDDKPALAGAGSSLLRAILSLERRARRNFG